MASKEGNTLCILAVQMCSMFHKNEDYVSLIEECRLQY